MTPYVFFLDIDDTLALYPNPPTMRVLQALRTAREQGHKVFLNTGRGASFLPPYTDQLSLDGVVSGCGAYIVCDGQVIFEKDVPTEDCLRVCRMFADQDDMGILFEGTKRLVRYRTSIWECQDDWITTDSLPELERLLNKYAVSKISLNNDIDPAIIPELENYFYVIWHPKEHYTECIPKNCSKGTGVKRVMEHYGLPMEASVAVGDSENDLDMIRAAGIGAVMGQARPEIKAEADRITESIKNDGVAVLIEELIRHPLP